MTIAEFQDEIFPLKDKIFRFACKILKDEIEAEDAAQEVLLKLWKNKNRLREIQSKEAWCMTVTRNLCFDWLKKRKARTVELNDSIYMKPDSVTPSSQMESQDALAKVKKIISDLPKKQGLVFHLREIEGLSYKEIAASLEMNLETVKVNLFRARMRLRREYQQIEAYGS